MTAILWNDFAHAGPGCYEIAPARIALSTVGQIGMARKILSVGASIPGGEIELAHHLSGRSLLDADIIVFSPEVPYGYERDTYMGKPCLSDDASFRAKEAIAHWRRELAAAVDAGKLVLVLLERPQVVYVATGRTEYSGTGRNARGSRIVEQLSSYSSVPLKWQFHAASGTEMEIVPEARYFAEYWEEFGPHSQYEVFLEGEIKERLVQTKSGHRLVGAAVRIGRGALLAVPALVLDEDAFMETKHVDGKEEQFWTESARRFGKRFVSSLVGLRESLLSEVESTPPPSWAQNDDYRLAEEGKIEKQIEDATARIAALEDSKRAFEAQLLAAGSIRGLLFEQGRPLEQAVLQALSLLGFKAERLRENNSEFDAVFVSDEGRCLGEVEGKDNRLLILTSSVSWSGT